MALEKASHLIPKGVLASCGHEHFSVFANPKQTFLFLQLCLTDSHQGLGSFMTFWVQFTEYPTKQLQHEEIAFACNITHLKAIVGELLHWVAL